MTDHPAIRHDSFRIERLYPRCLAHVWSAWTDPQRKWSWFGLDQPMPADYAPDIRPGGVERARFTSPMGQHENHTTYLDVAKEDRLVFAYSMSLDGRVHSASVATVEFFDHGGGTRLVFTESIATIGESDGKPGREHGWTALLTALDLQLAAETPVA